MDPLFHIDRPECTDQGGDPPAAPPREREALDDPERLHPPSEEEAVADLPPSTIVVVLSRDGAFGVRCTCGFEELTGQPYRAAYELAGQHLATHRSGTTFAAPDTVGGLLAISPDAGETVIRDAGRITMAFLAWCYAAGWDDRVHDPEAFCIFLDSPQDATTIDPSVVTQYRAWAATVEARSSGASRCEACSN